MKWFVMAAILGAGILGTTGCMVADSGSCGGCGTHSTKHGGTTPPPVTQAYAYKCPMDGAMIDAPGACPKCGMTLDERHRAVRKESSTPTQYAYKCPMDGATLDAPGPCPKCGMTLDERYRVAK